MIVVLAALVLASAGASPLVERQLLCPTAIPSMRCQQELSEFQQVQTQVFTNLSTLTPEQVRSTLGPLLEVFCSAECLSPILQTLDCTNNSFFSELIRVLYCSRHADGSFCPVKVLSEAASGGSLVPPCATAGSCNSSCQRSYLEVRGRLGCCTTNWFGTSGIPFISEIVGRFYNICNVTLDNPCTLLGGAPVLYLNFLVLLVFSIVAIAIV